MPITADRVLYFKIHSKDRIRPVGVLTVDAVYEHIKTKPSVGEAYIEVVYAKDDSVSSIVLDIGNSMGTLMSGVSIDECELEISPGGDKGVLGTFFMAREDGQWVPDECHLKPKSDSRQFREEIMERLDGLQKDIEEVFGARKPLSKPGPLEGPDLDIDQLK